MAHVEAYLCSARITGCSWCVVSVWRWLGGKLDMPPRISDGRLSFGTQNDDVARLHQAIQELGRDRAPRRTTRSLVRRRNQGSGQGAPGRAVAPLHRHRRPRHRASDRRTARRTGRCPTRRPRHRLAGRRPPLAVRHVKLFRQTVDGEQVVGLSPLDAADGSYMFRYELPAQEGGRGDLRVAVFDDHGQMYESAGRALGGYRRTLNPTIELQRRSTH
jgi:hypothetical protein